MFRTVIELLRRAAAIDRPRPAIIGNERSVGYPELMRAAEAVAATLRARNIARFGVLDHDAIDVVTLLAGASLAGAEACLYPPTESGDVAALARRLEHPAIVSDQAVLAPDGVDVLTVADLLDESCRPSTDVPKNRPLVVLTTGTTGEPKAVLHDWTRLLRPYAATPAAPDQRWLLAYGLHQFGGLQIVLHVLAAASTLVAPAPRRPREGLEAMRAHAVEHASATPTYWRFLLLELRDGGPRPALRQITLGGEAVPGPLLGELRRTFPDARISQVYAANEYGSMRSVRDGSAGLPMSALGERPDADVALKIVDGELWVRSRTGMLGYLGSAVDDPDAWRPTGDLVEVVGDRVHFRGRTSEIINVGGVKVHPLPIEERIGAVPGVALVRVYGRPNPVAGAIVAAEIVARDNADRDEIRDAIRAACVDLPDAARPRSIRFVEQLATAGDKIKRGST